MDLAQLLADPPLVHKGGTLTWELAHEVMEFLDSELQPGWKTIETGAGISTILFAMKSCEHICIVPFADEVQRILAYCEERDIPTGTVVFQVEKSQDILPALDLADLDLVLIDGDHAFPAPFIDWYYTAGAVKEGGRVIVDDTQLWTGDVLKQFLHMDDGWKMSHSFLGRAAIFEKRAGASVDRGWLDQPLVARRSKPLIRALKYRQALDLLRRGHLRRLISGIWQDLFGRSQ